VNGVRRNHVAAALLAVIGAGVLAVAATGSVSKPTVKATSNATLGKIVVSASGLTLYHYTQDHGKVVKCSGACAAQWPPVLIAKNAKPVAGPGVTASKLGTVKRSDGTTQVTYGGYPLYRFAGDTKPGQVTGQGLEKAWYAISPTGALVKAEPAAASAATASSSSSSPSSSSSTSSSSSSPSTGSTGSTGATGSTGGAAGYDY
jgi:predicted lipoprotein with Yx(FWY)xxD motif